MNTAILLLWLSASTTAGAHIWRWNFVKNSTTAVELYRRQPEVDDNQELAAALGEEVPARIFSIFGAEDSGTKFVARLVAHAAGIAKFGTWAGEAAVRARDATGNVTEVQHLSQPWGIFCRRLPRESFPAAHKAAAEALVAAPGVDASLFTGRVRGLAPTLSKFSTAALEKGLLPGRFFVNVTHHTLEGATRKKEGDQQQSRPPPVITAILVVRDRGIQNRGKRTRQSNGASHCRYSEAARAEDAHAYALTARAVEVLPPARRVMVSCKSGSIPILTMNLSPS